MKLSKTHYLGIAFGAIALVSTLVGCLAPMNSELELMGARKHFAEREAQAIAEPYHGVVTSSGKVENLYAIEKTGVSTLPIVTRAEQFINALNPDEKSKVLFDINAKQWRRWSNVDNGIYIRQGLSLADMNPAQRQALFALLGESLSVQGMEQVRGIMRSEHTLKELNDGDPHLDEELYFITIMGQPSITQPWGWQFEGHHLALNYVILGDQVVMTPVFMGAEPVRSNSGKYQGNEVLQQEQDLGLAFMRQLTDEQQQQAIIAEKRSRNIVAEANKDNLVLDFEGLSASNLNPRQKEALLTIIHEYVSNMRNAHAEIKMAEVRRHLDQTWFAWSGDTDEHAVFYYRIHSPVLLIEFDHQQPVGLPSNGSRGKATREHIHTMVRTPNGNDYGKDLLRQHWEKHHKTSTEKGDK